MTGNSTNAWRPPKSERYVLSVDHQAKSSFDSYEAANAEAERISESFPNVVVKVSDIEQNSVTTLKPLAGKEESDVE